MTIPPKTALLVQAFDKAPTLMDQMTPSGRGTSLQASRTPSRSLQKPKTHMSRIWSPLRCVGDGIAPTIVLRLSDELANILHAKRVFSPAFPRFRFLERESCPRLSRLRCSRSAGQASVRYMLYHYIWFVLKSPQNTSLETDSARNLWSVDVSSKSCAERVPKQNLNHTTSLHRFLQRLARHPTLQRSTLVRAFFESTEWVRALVEFSLPSLMSYKHVHMHQHMAHPPGLEPSPGIIDNISDTLLNAFARVRKPDDRFLSMRESVDQFEEGLVLSERLWSRVRNRTSGEFIFISSFFLFFCSRMSEAK